jgi:pimeloyl-ACP methyl ester carboxylesterase
VSHDTVVLHGRRIAYRRTGSGPAIVLLHGIAGRGSSWDAVAQRLAADHDVIALDLPGHGDSDPPVGDFSTGAYACTLRDLLTVLEVESATIVGHSLGGGIAMQFSYQFPERVQRMVLVSSGGLGREVSPLVRAAGLPGSELVVPVLASAPARFAGRALGAALSAVGRPPDTDLREAGLAVGSLADPGTRRAFLGTVRSLMDARGQRVSATDKLYLAEDIPTLIVWGARDSIIPVAHGRAAAEAMRGSRFELFEAAGHFPQLDEPDRFALLLRAFVADVPAAAHDPERLRRRLAAARDQPAEARLGAS